MLKFEITNSTSGAGLGAYHADDSAGALDAMARDAGYRDFADSCAVTDSDGSDLIVSEIDE